MQFLFVNVLSLVLKGSLASCVQLMEQPSSTEHHATGAAASDAGLHQAFNGAALLVVVGVAAGGLALLAGDALAVVANVVGYGVAVGAGFTVDVDGGVIQGRNQTRALFGGKTDLIVGFFLAHGAGQVQFISADVVGPSALEAVFEGLVAMVLAGSVSIAGVLDLAVAEFVAGIATGGILRDERIDGAALVCAIASLRDVTFPDSIAACSSLFGNLIDTRSGTIAVILNIARSVNDTTGLGDRLKSKEETISTGAGVSQVALIGRGTTRRSIGIMILQASALSITSVWVGTLRVNLRSTAVAFRLERIVGAKFAGSITNLLHVAVPSGLTTDTTYLHHGIHATTSTITVVLGIAESVAWVATLGSLRLESLEETLSTGAG